MWVSVCVYYVWMYVYMYICVCVLVCICICMCVFGVCVCVCVYVQCVFVCVWCVYVYVFVIAVVWLCVLYVCVACMFVCSLCVKLFRLSYYLSLFLFGLSYDIMDVPWICFYMCMYVYVCLYPRLNLYSHTLALVWCGLSSFLSFWIRYRLLNIKFALFVCVYCATYGIYESKAHSKNASQELNSNWKMCKRILTR